MKNETQISILAGIMLGMLVLIFIIYTKINNVTANQVIKEAERVNDFKAWADKICADGWSSVELMPNGEYRAKCAKSCEYYDESDKK